MVTEDSERKRAIERLEEKRSFAAHAGAYVIVNLFLVGLWAVTGAGYFWPVWSILGWGIGLGFHAWSTYFERPITEADIDEEMRKGRGTIA